MTTKNINTSQNKIAQAIATYLENFFQTVSLKEIKNSKLFTSGTQLPNFKGSVILEPQCACLFFVDNQLHLRVHKSILLETLNNEYLDDNDIPVEQNIFININDQAKKVFVFYRKKDLWFILKGEAFDQLFQIGIWE